MANEAAWPLGAQMAVVFVGINVFFSMALSAVLSLLVLIIVQVNKMIKQKTGKLASSNSVPTLGAQLNHKFKDEGQSTGKSMEEEVVTKGDKRVKWADVRKRRPSNAGFVVLTTVNDKSSSPLSAAEHSQLSLTPVELDHSHLEKRNDKTIPAFKWDNSSRVVRSRQGRTKSKSRVSPDINQAPMPRHPDKDPNEWAVIQHVSSWAKEKSSVPSPDREQSPRDNIVTPSACSIHLSPANEQSKPGEKASVFVNNMDAYDIW